MDDDDLTFYRRRLAEERALARTADIPEAKIIHRQLADNYRHRIEELSRISARS
jgi:hypothetical protein